MPLTDEQKTEIQREVSRIFERLVSAKADLKKDDLPVFIEPEEEESDWQIGNYDAIKIDLARSLQEIPERYRRLLHDKYVGGYTVPELAEKYVLSEPAIKSRLYQAVATLRARLDAQSPGTQSPSQTQPLEPLVRVIARAVEVLGTSEKALRWINAPVRSLGDQTPVSLLSSAEGIERVEDALGSIEHGVW